jgi:hypothetical protein
VENDNFITFRLDVIKLQEVQCDRPSCDIPDDGHSEAETCRNSLRS